MPSPAFVSGSHLESTTNTNTFSVPAPANLAHGQIIFAFVWLNGSDTTAIPTISGFTQLFSNVTNANEGNVYVFGRVIDGTEPANFTVNTVGNASSSSFIFAQFNSHAAAVDGIAAGLSSASTDAIAPSVSPVGTPNELVVWYTTNGTLIISGVGSGVIQRVAATATPRGYLYTKDLTASGPTGTVTATWPSTQFGQAVALTIRAEQIGAAALSNGAARLVVSGNLTSNSACTMTNGVSVLTTATQIAGVVQLLTGIAILYARGQRVSNQVWTETSPVGASVYTESPKTPLTWTEQP